MTGLTPIRTLALAIVNEVVPSNYGDPKFTRIIDGMYTEGPGAGTTCGFLASYLLFSLGCRAPEIINRNDPESGLKYQIGANISRLIGGAKALGAWRVGPAGIKPGDILFLSNGPPATEHVGIFMRAPDALHWETADAGQTNAQGHQAARKVLRTFDGARLGTPNGTKTIQGYVDIEAVPRAVIADFVDWTISPRVKSAAAVLAVAGVVTSVALVGIGLAGHFHESRGAA